MAVAGPLAVYTGTQHPATTSLPPVAIVTTGIRWEEEKEEAAEEHDDCQETEQESVADVWNAWLYIYRGWAVS